MLLSESFFLLVFGKIGIMSASQVETYNLASTIMTVLSWNIRDHKYTPLTVWLWDEIKLGNDTSSLLDPDSLLSSLEASQNFPPVILGSFGQQLRQRHSHLTSFIFLLLTTSKKDFTDLASFVELNGNRRRDRYLLLGEEETLRTNFRNQLIHGLKEKMAIVTSPNRPPFFLVDTPVYNKEGEMTEIEQLPDSPPPAMGRHLNGRHIKITGCLLPTWLYRVSDENGPRGVEHDGSNYRLFLESSRAFNYTFELDAPIGQGYGALLDNGTWTGMAADLYYTERGYDIAVLLGHVLAWFDFVEFASTLDFAKLVFVVAPPKLEVSEESFLLPFQKETWLSVIAITVIMSATMWAFLIFVRSKEKEPLFNSLMLPFAIAVEQQNSKIPVGVRNLVAVWSVAMIMTGTGYRSNLASFLSVPTVSSVPATFQELADSGYHIVLNNLGVAEMKFFELTDNPTAKKIKARLTYNPDPVACPANAFLQGKTACIEWTPLVSAFASSALTLENTRLEPLVMSSEPVLPVSMSIGFLKDSPIVDSFYPISSFIYESGLYNSWTEQGYYFFKLVGKAGKKTPEMRSKLKEFEDELGSVNDVRPFTLAHFKIPFYAFLTGIGLALLIFGSEVLFVHLKKKKRKNVVEKSPTKIFVVNELGRLHSNKK